MAVTVESFKQFFEEYRKTENATVQAKLTQAVLQINSSVWGDKTDLGTLYLTAHMLALAPAGQNMKLEPENAGKTVYWFEYTMIRSQVTYGFRTAGVPSAAALEDPANG